MRKAHFQCEYVVAAETWIRGHICHYIDLSCYNQGRFSQDKNKEKEIFSSTLSTLKHSSENTLKQLEEKWEPQPELWLTKCECRMTGDVTLE